MLRIIIEFATVEDRQRALECVVKRFVTAEWTPNPDNELQGTLLLRTKTQWKAFADHLWNREPHIGMTLEFI